MRRGRAGSSIGFNSCWTDLNFASLTQQGSDTCVDSRWAFGRLHNSMNENEQAKSELAGAPSPIPVLGSDVIEVLHVEDDPAYREAIADQLSAHGFVVRGFADASSLADGLAVSRKADIILLDWDLPGVSGIELLVELRQCGVNLPVVFLTGYDFIAHENLAFETGAVDFIDKARGVEILARRLRRVLKSRKPVGASPAASLMVCGKLVLNQNVSRAYWSDSDVGLTLVEYNVVQLLVSHAGRWVTYRSIYDRVHYEGFIGGTGADGYRINVRGIIKRIRKKFLQSDETFDEIDNFVGLGYRWASPTSPS
jgi:two-component system, OmpR family, response regulator ChvI